MQNQEQELITQLSSNKRSVRIQAIVKLTRAGKSEQSLAALQPLMNENDREISFFATQAATKIAQKLKINLDDYCPDNQLKGINKDNNREPQSEPNSEPNSEPDSQSSNVQIFFSRKNLLSPEKESIESLLNAIRQEPEKITDDLLPAVGAFLNRHGDASDGALLERFLLKENSNLALPLISAAEHIAPAILPRVLPNLLASPEPLIRSRSVSALRKIDPEEAERHFSDLLSSRNAEDRLAGIAIAFVFPYDRVKGYILSMIPEETDSEVLVACQTVLASNPDLDTALSILDSIDAVAAEQKGRLTLIFKTICQAIATTNVLPADQSTPEMIIKLWKQQRLEAFLYDLEIQLAFADEKKKKSIIAWIQKNREHPKVAELIDRLGKNPQTEDTYRQLRKANQTNQIEATTNQEQEKQRNSFEAQEKSDTNADKIAFLKNLELDHFAANKNWILKEAETGESELRAEALNALLRVYPQGRLIDLAKLAVTAKEEEVRIAGFRILEKLDPQYLKGKISEFLVDADPNLRIRAVKFGLTIKESEAIDALKRLMNAKEQSIRSNAANCLSLCPFDKIFSILMDQLDREEHPVIAKQLTTILLNHPSKEVLKALDNITRTSNPAVSMVISQARNDIFEKLSQMPEIEEEKINTAPEKDTAKPYSVGKVRELSKKNQQWKPSYKKDAAREKKKLEINWSLVIPGSIIIIFLGLVPIMLLSDRGSENSPPQPPAAKDWRNSDRVKPQKIQIPEKFRMNRPCSLNGIIEKIISDSSFVMIHDNSQIMVKFETPRAKNLKAGDKIEVTIVPYRVNPNGIILSRGQNISSEKGDQK